MFSFPHNMNLIFSSHTRGPRANIPAHLHSKCKMFVPAINSDKLDILESTWCLISMTTSRPK